MRHYYRKQYLSSAIFHSRWSSGIARDVMSCPTVYDAIACGSIDRRDASDMPRYWAGHCILGAIYTILAFSVGGAL
jgi:hypothetical protein